MNVSVWKKLIFTTLTLLVFFIVAELLSRFLLPDKNDQLVIIERIMNTDIRHDWLETDPVLFWKLAGTGPGETVFRVEDIPSGFWEELCSADIEEKVSSKPSEDEPKCVNGKTELIENSNKNEMEKRQVKSEVPVKSGQLKRLSAAVDRYMIQPVSPELPDGIRRIICLGDSCTFFGQPSYPAVLEVLMNCDLPGKNWQVINAGVPAYSSLQGFNYLQTRLIDYEPNIVTVYFGWNDHWLAHERSDAEHYNGHIPPLLARLRRGLRFFGVLDRLYFKIRSGRMPVRSGFRVSPEDYHINLTHMAEVAQKNGFSMVFLTAPHGFDPGNPPVYFLNMGYFDDLSLLNDTHNQYNDIVRRVAAETGSTLVDLARIMDVRPDRNILFLTDGIHLSDSGIKTVAGYVHRALTALPESVHTVETDI
jgi:lysophospholipase L1-like esterase